ncbi:MAG: hypothetical protein IJW29_05245 [Clostridia bacterium]|nr:hypothetical protein [Clostridia bacterium]
MKHRFTYFGTAALSLVLCLFLLTGAALPAAAQTGGESALPSLDYGIADREDNTTLSATELYERLLGTSPTDAEARYLLCHGITMTYNALVPDNRISTSYDSELGVLTIEILPYTYVAENGATVTWIPTRATVGDATPALTEQNGVYTCRLENIFYSEDFDMHVDYAWEIEIPAEVISELRDCSFEAGSEALAIKRAYEATLADYEGQLAAHEDWVAYSDWLKNVYGAWETEYAAYDAAKQAFIAYSAAYDAYEAELALYKQWQDYFEYTDFVTNHLDDYNKYKTYLSQLEPVTRMLTLLESLFVADSHGWQMYGSIMGGSVDLVLANEDALVASGNNPDDIRAAGDATVALRKLLPKYAAIREAEYENDHERLAAMFNYYSTNYKALGKQFKILYSSLNALFQNTVVKLYMLEKYPDKFDHYLQFVGQLYVIATCLDQSGDRDPDWSISDKKLSTVVEAVHLLPDGNWDPATCSMPAEYVEPVEYVAPVDPPTEPQPAKEPTPPTPVVEDPGEAPDEPENPFEGNIPTETAHPGIRPASPTFDEVELALMKEIEDGVLTASVEAVAPKTLCFETATERLVSVRNLKTVSFYDLNGNLLHRVLVDYGDSVNYPVPEMEATAQYTFIPQGWVAVDGSVVSLTSITTDLSMIPSYAKILRYYDITWHLGDATEVTTWPYGSTPKPPAKWALSSYVQGHYSYSFSGWDTAPVTVTGDATYRGEMLSTLRTYTVTWILYGDRTVVEEWPALSTPTYSGDTDRAPDAYVYTFKGWTGPVGAITGDTTYRAHYDSVRLATGGSSTAMEILHGDKELRVLATQDSVNVNNAARLAADQGKLFAIEWEGGIALTFDADQLTAFLNSACQRVILERVAVGSGTSYRLRFCDAVWNTLDTVGTGMTLLLPQNVAGEASSVWLLKTAEGQTRVEGESVSLSGSAEWTELPAYTLTLTPSSLYDMSALASRAAVGEVVSLRIRCQYGYEVVGATVCLADGTPVQVSEALTFVMPAEPVTVTLEVAQIRYSVTFIVEGEVIHSAEYLLGEEIFVPEDPTLPAKDGYSYTFIGWGGDIPAMATGEERVLVFHASFVRASQNVDYSTGHNNNMLIEVYLPIFLAALVLLTGGLITWRVLRRRARRRAAAAVAEPAEGMTTQELLGIDLGQDSEE